MLLFTATNSLKRESVLLNTDNVIYTIYSVKEEGSGTFDHFSCLGFNRALVVYVYRVIKLLKRK
jgi:hypothetical protein